VPFIDQLIPGRRYTWSSPKGAAVPAPTAIAA